MKVVDVGVMEIKPGIFQIQSLGEDEQVIDSVVITEKNAQDLVRILIEWPIL